MSNADTNTCEAADAREPITIHDLLKLFREASGGNYETDDVVITFDGPLLAEGVLPTVYFQRRVIDGFGENVLIIEPVIDNTAVLEIAAEKDEAIARLEDVIAELTVSNGLITDDIETAEQENAEQRDEIAALKLLVPKKRGPKPGTKYAARAPKKPAKRAKR
jgi:hypothetical protein